MASKKSKVGRRPTTKAKSSPKAVTAKGKVSPKAMTKLMTKLQQPPPEPQFVAGQPDTQAKSAAFGEHMKRLMDQQG